MIVFDNDNKKNVYFIAEIKHTSDEDKTVDLRLREDGKIECARKYFASLNEADIAYDVIHGYEDLMYKILNK